MIKKIPLIFIISMTMVFQVSSCIRSNPSDNYPMVITPFPTVINNEMGFPKVLATPVEKKPDTEEEIKKIIENKFYISSNPKCNSDILNSTDSMTEKPVLEFSVSTNDPISNEFILEIADNFSHTNRAILACQDSNRCQENLYVSNAITQETTIISWSTRFESRYLGNMMWIGDDLLVVMEQSGVEIASIAVIDINKKAFVLFWRNDSYCNEMLTK